MSAARRRWRYDQRFDQSRPKGKLLDPDGLLRQVGRPQLVAEGAMLAYMNKNKDWCQIPDEMVDGLKKTHAQDTAFSAKACGYAAKIKKMKEQQADGGAPQAQQLPTGPSLSSTPRGPARCLMRLGRASVLAANAGFRASLCSACPSRSADRLAIAARAMLAIRGARWACRPSRPGSLAPAVVLRRRGGDARRRLHL